MIMDSETKKIKNKDMKMNNMIVRDIIETEYLEKVYEFDQ